MKGRRQDGKRGGCHHRRANPLSQPSPDQYPFASSQTAHERRDPKQQRPPNKQASPAEQISRVPAEQQEPTIGEQVRACDPLQALDREVQISSDLRQCNIHDGRIEKIDERDRAHQDKGELAATRSKKRRWS